MSIESLLNVPNLLTFFDLIEEKINYRAARQKIHTHALSNSTALGSLILFFISFQPIASEFDVKLVTGGSCTYWADVKYEVNNGWMVNYYLFTRSAHRFMFIFRFFFCCFVYLSMNCNNFGNFWIQSGGRMIQIDAKKPTIFTFLTHCFSHHVHHHYMQISKCINSRTIDISEMKRHIKRSIKKKKNIAKENSQLWTLSRISWELA